MSADTDARAGYSLTPPHLLYTPAKQQQAQIMSRVPPSTPSVIVAVLAIAPMLWPPPPPPPPPAAPVLLADGAGVGAVEKVGLSVGTDDVGTMVGPGVVGTLVGPGVGCGEGRVGRGVG